MIHNLKTWPEYFQAVWEGKKTFEIRIDDRNFQVGDVLCLEEWEPKGHFYTGRTMDANVTYVLRGYPAIKKGYVVLSISVYGYGG